MRKPPTRSAVFFVAAAAFGAGTIAAMVLYGNIVKRKMEARSSVLRIADIDETTLDPAVWGMNFPREYDGYIRTSDNARARFKWSEARPPEDGSAGAAGDEAKATKADSKLTGDPRLKTIFNGYAFAIDYRERRGHAYMLLDQRETERVKQKPQPGALNDPLNSKNGRRLLFASWERVNHLPYAEATALVKHPLSCLDCHDPKSMGLRITRPAFIEGIASRPTTRTTSRAARKCDRGRRQAADVSLEQRTAG